MGFLVCLGAALVAQAADIDISGTVVDTTGAAIPNAGVALKRNNLSGYTDANGMFKFFVASTSALPSSTGRTHEYRLQPRGSLLCFAVAGATATGLRTSIEVMDCSGRSVAKVLDRRLSEGVYTVAPFATITERVGAAAYVVRVRTGRHDQWCVMMSGPDRYASSSLRRVGELQEYGSALAKVTALLPDTLIIKKFSYITRRLAVSSGTVTFTGTVLRRDSLERKVDSLLALMTLDEKIGQMIQANRQALTADDDVRTLFLGSLFAGAPNPVTALNWANMVDALQDKALTTRLHIPLLYASDMVHGNSLIKDAVIFPHNVAIGCTRNTALTEQEWRITALEGVATGIRWTFGPCIAVPRDERWGRTYEGFGETPELAVDMGAAAVRGAQGVDCLGSPRIAACAKHYLADGGTAWNTSPIATIDRGRARIDLATMRRIHLPGYIASVREGVASVMLSYSYWNDTSMHAEKYLITDVLKKEQGFEGLVVSDYGGYMTVQPTGADSLRISVKASVNAGMDMAMCGGDYRDVWNILKALVTSNEVPLSRINDAVRRILRVKYHIGVFDTPKSDRTLLASLGSTAHRDIARQCVRQSLVLLKNQNSILPLSKSGKRIVVVGRHANDLSLQCGGWTIGWQNMDTVKTTGTTILSAIRQTVADSSLVTYSPGGDNLGTQDVAVVVIGEIAYAEWWGDVAWPGYGSMLIPNLQIPSTSKTLLTKVQNAGIPIVAVLISGRPLVLGTDLDKCSAFVAAWLPGTEGRGVSDVLFGDFKPAGRSSHTWPRTEAQVPINYGDATYDPLFAYGFGLTW